MSTFRVKLGNASNPELGSDPSIQRTMYVSGPRGIRRKLKDGETFTDCNYWKQFAYPQVPADEAFIEVLVDDGSLYSSILEENNVPRVYTLSVDNGTTYEQNKVDILEDNGGAAGFVQIHNFTGGGLVQVRINGMLNAVFNLDEGSIQQFNNGDISITKLEFHNESGIDSTVQIILSVLNTPKS
jgi:hypothetical protein